MPRQGDDGLAHALAAKYAFKLACAAKCAIAPDVRRTHLWVVIQEANHIVSKLGLRHNRAHHRAARFSATHNQHAHEVIAARAQLLFKQAPDGAGRAKQGNDQYTIIKKQQPRKCERTRKKCNRN